MKQLIILAVMAVFQFVLVEHGVALSILNDGKMHKIDSVDDYVIVSAGSSVYFGENGKVDYLRVHDLCTVTMFDSIGYGGVINHGLELWDNSIGGFWGGFVNGQVMMFGSSRIYLRHSIFDLNILTLHEQSIFEFQAGSGVLETTGFYLKNSSWALLLGGSVSSNEYILDDYSRMSIEGGSVSGSFVANKNAYLDFNGGGFKLDGQSLPGGSYKSLTAGRLTGYLRDGSAIDVHISINDEAQLHISETIIPEPATVLLLGLGGFAAFKRKSVL